MRGTDMKQDLGVCGRKCSVPPPPYLHHYVFFDVFFFFLILHYATLSMQLAACKKDVIREFRLRVCVCVYMYVCVCLQYAGRK